ncbi:helix-hairpin-helix domain-containing protein [Halarchaeum sp. P4]|uniref:helix-hairpin-helix domain-containing protein n=1 Tax=Halarchaeum sp. P4 TaxID=3421639 RepID=UPI003EBDC85A
MDVELLGLLFLGLWMVAVVVRRFEEQFPVRVRVWLGGLDLEDPRTEEEIKLAYVEGEISMEEMERRLSVAVNPRADKLRRTVETVSGIGPDTAWSIAEHFHDEDALREASREELEDVPNVGEQRSQALRERL